MLEPDKATLAHTFRRIALGRHCSLLLTLSASQPRGLPLELCVLGPDAAARRYQDLLHAGSSTWESVMYVHQAEPPSHAVRLCNLRDEDMAVALPKNRCQSVLTYRN